MNYIKNNLNNNEEIIYTGNIHWITLANPMVIISTLLTIVSIIGIIPFHWLFIVILMLGLLYGGISYWTTDIVITNQRVIKKVGLIERKILELNLSKIETVNLNQSIFGRILNYGVLNFIGTGATALSLEFINNPFKFKSEINKAIEEKK